jgi:hypothetical protein
MSELPIDAYAVLLRAKGMRALPTMATRRGESNDVFDAGGMAAWNYRTHGNLLRGRLVVRLRASNRNEAPL